MYLITTYEANNKGQHSGIEVARATKPTLTEANAEARSQADDCDGWTTVEECDENGQPLDPPVILTDFGPSWESA